MDRRTFIKSGLVLTAGIPLLQGCEWSSNKNVRDELFELFRNPPATSKPFVRWWWHGNKLSAGEILRELDVMKEAGIGGVEINSIAFPDGLIQLYYMKQAGIRDVDINTYAHPGGDDLGIPSLTWLSPEWVEMVKVALKGAEERGLICDIIVGSGWPFGGEFLEPEERTQVLTRGEQIVKGPARLEFRTADLLKKLASGNEFASNELYAVCLAPSAMSVFTPPKTISFDKNTPTLVVDVPEGEHVLYTLARITGRSSVNYGTPGSGGPMLNHYSRQAVEKYLNHMSDRLFPAIRGLKGFRSLFCDSMELDANWCRDFPEEFKRRKGYDVTPYLPFILSRKSATALTGEAKEEVDRVRYDFLAVRVAIMHDCFLQPYMQWCHKLGVKARVQAYGRGFHPLDASLQVDIPECETWLIPTPSKKIDFARHPAYTHVNKYVASAAHFSGKKVVSCEEVTNCDLTFNATLEWVKMTGDQSNLSGVTHSMLHGFNYSPPEAPFPGWIRFGTFFSDRNPWWPYFKSWATYKARLSAVLQETDAFADIAVMHPLADMWTLHGLQEDPSIFAHFYPEYQYRVWEAIHQNGNSCDYISEHILQQSKSKNGFLTYNTRKYHTLILLEVESVEPETAEALAAFAAVGGRLIFVGKAPHRSPGWNDHKRRSEKVRQTIADMKQRHPSKLFTVEAPGDDMIAWFRGVRQQCGLEPYLHIESPDPYVSQIRHRTADRDFLFMVNYSDDRRITQNVRFAEAGDRKPFLWDAETGEKHPYPTVKDRTLTVDLPPATSQLIVFEKATAEGEITAIAAPPDEGVELDGKWDIRLEHINGHTAVRKQTALFNMADDPQTQSFAGHVYYTLDVDDAAGSHYLDLGKVHGVSEATVNGEPLGCKWYGRHLYRLPEHIANAGRKRIEVKVTTTAGNYLKSSPNNIIVHSSTVWQPRQPAGMIGPVRLLRSDKIDKIVVSD